MAEAKRLSKKEFDDLPWMHIYPQSAYHSPVRILGNAPALRALAAALLAAAESGTGTSEAITHDGEGYGVEIERTNMTGLRYASLPYVAEWCRDLKTQAKK